MPLRREEAEFPLVRGVRTRRHPHRNLIPDLKECKNADFSEPGAIRKRRGYARIGQTETGGDSLPDAWERCVSKGDRLLAWGDDGTVCEYVEQADEMRIGGGTYGAFVRADSDIVPRVGILGAQGDEESAGRSTVYAQCNGYEAIGYGGALSGGGGRDWNVQIQDQDTGSVGTTVSPKNIADGSLRVVSVGSYFKVFYTDTANNLKLINVLTTDLSITSATVATNVHASSIWLDVEPYGSTAVVAYSTTTPEIRVITVADSGTTVVDSVTFDSIAANLCIGLYTSANGHVVAYANTTAGLKIQGLTTGLVASSAHTLDAGATGCVRVALAPTSDANVAAVIYNEADDVTIDGVQVSGAAAAYVGATLYGDSTQTGHAVSLLTGVASDDSGAYFVVSKGRAALGDNTAVLVRARFTSIHVSDLEPVATYRMLAAAGGGDYQQQNVVAKWAQVGSEWRSAIPVLVDIDNGFWSVARVEFEPFAGGTSEASGLTLLPGSAAYATDLVEQVGFPYPPSIVGVTVSNGAGSLDTSASYSWVAVYEYTDRAGNVHRSPPSLPATASTGASDDTADVEVTTPFARDGMSVHTVLYRTEGGGTVHYRATTYGTDVDDQITDAGTVTITDTDDDDTVTAREILYTEGGRLDAYPMPPTGLMAAHGNRVWAVHEDGTLWPSRELVQGEAPAFNPALAVGNGGLGKPRAIASEGDGASVVAFWAAAIGRVYGDGPGPTGVGGSFSPMQFLRGNTVGCSNPDSVVAMPDGTMFQSTHQGIWLLPTGAPAPVHVGKGAEDLLGSSTVVRAVSLQDRKEVRFLLDSGDEQLVYHYEDEARDAEGYGAWSLHELNPTGTNAVDIAVLNGRCVFADDGGGLHQERADSGSRYDGTGTYVPLDFTTGWIGFGSLQGAKRLWDLWLLGENPGGSTFSVYVESGRNDSADEYDAAGVSDANMQGGPGLRVHLAEQRAEVYRVRMQDTTSGENLHNMNVKFTGLRLEYGRTGRARRAGAVLAPVGRSEEG